MLKIELDVIKEVKMAQLPLMDFTCTSSISDFNDVFEYPLAELSLHKDDDAVIEW